jgi:hypothetical protein
MDGIRNHCVKHNKPDSGILHIFSHMRNLDLKKDLEPGVVAHALNPKWRSGGSWFEPDLGKNFTRPHLNQKKSRVSWCEPVIPARWEA